MQQSLTFVFDFETVGDLALPMPTLPTAAGRFDNCRNCASALVLEWKLRSINIRAIN